MYIVIDLIHNRFFNYIILKIVFKYVIHVSNFLQNDMQPIICDRLATKLLPLREQPAV